jgi:hypothetical protein
MAGVTLLDFLSERFIAPITRKSWLGNERVRVDDYLRAAQRVFESCALLGHRFRDRLPIFARVLGEPGQETEALKRLAELAVAQEPVQQTEPRDFLDLFFRPEVARLESQLLGRSQDTAASRPTLGKLARQKLPRAELQNALKSAGEKGLALGIHSPELVAGLCARSIEVENWKLLRGRTSSLPSSPPPPIPLDERQNEATAMLREYLELAQPDLLARLGLWPEGENDFVHRFRAITSRWGSRAQ